jgi:hypothetical protein
MAIEYTSVRALAERFGTLPVEMRAQLRPRLKAAGGLIAAGAKSNASWSTRIPGAVSVSASFTSRTGGASVKVSAAKAPHARAYEGIEGNATFRHPVFGGSTWVDEDTRPFLVPAVNAKRAAVMADIEAAVKSVNTFGL